MSRPAPLPRETVRPTTPVLPTVRTEIRPRAPAPPVWPPSPRLTPELIAAYKRKGDCLRAQAFAAALQRVAVWLAGGRES